MPTADLWRALAEQAVAWRGVPLVERFTRELPANAGQGSHGLPGMLQHIHAGASGLISNPLRLASYLPMACSVVPDVDAQVLMTKHQDWVEAATRAEAAHRLTVGWLRARFPRYPAMPAPQLSPGSSLTTDEFSHRLVWPAVERSQGLHLVDVPNQITDALQCDKECSRRIKESTRAVADALVATPEWSQLEEAGDLLDEAARTELRATRSRLRDLLAPASVDAHEPNLALPRAKYRNHVVREEVEKLLGPSRDYAVAFDSADSMTELAASDVFAQLVCYSVGTLPVDDLQITPGEPPTVRFKTPDTMLHMPDPGSVYWLDDPLVQDAVHVTGVSMNFDQATGPMLTLSATVLSETSTAWR